MTVDPVRDWPIPPSGGFTVDDFLQMRDLPKHTELIDGGLVFVSPQRKWHRQVLDMFRLALDAQAPEGLRADREMAVRLGPRQMPEPDVLVVTSEAFDRPEPESYYFADDLVLAVEVVSPDSEERDRDTKPGKYARAGIPHFWRVERSSDDRVVVYAYELDTVSTCYVPVGIYHERLKTVSPFDIDIDLTTAKERS
ncbi:Uma2 family endonuclease [Nocardia caishijiensis]|uniref:Uma2 family endonuclease n=1 Tax=Nocardia caishijiensis TaxID=184756 RepID=A0ABQ6YQC2_9NOCA|nr:Uma2 family endonuclease [Nocardia caishijiensis]KAF0848007.1 Uma2 family endonuclease [Nocardia caishijiensis]